MKLIKAHRRTRGDNRALPKEELIPEIKFQKYKFNNRKVPVDKSKILFVSCFFEFGCETIGLSYCLPKILQKNPGDYVICVGWYGREYLYRHLVDEYWEIDESHQWLREFTQAFRHTSKNLEKFEDYLETFGKVYRGYLMGNICLGTTCLSCNHFWGCEKESCHCPKCNSHNIHHSLLGNIPFHKKFAVQVPRPSIKIQNIAKNYLKPNAVGIFARGRLTYGRNLRPEFYIKLIERLEEQGYNPIWLGEKQSVIPCPVSHITDFSRLPEARDLELTLAIVSQLQFTVQFWTASTRFASMMGVPWLLFETPDQICGNGQEGKRIALTTDFNKKKLVLAQYHNVVENEIEALSIFDQAVKEMNEDNWNDIIALVDRPEIIKMMLEKKNVWRGFD